MRRTRPGRLAASLARAGLIAAVGAVTLGAAHQQPAGDPATSVGDLRFHAAAVPFRHGTREARAEFSIRVPYQEIRFAPDGDRYSAKLRLTVQMWNSAGKRAGFLQREANLQSTDLAATTDSLLGEVYELGLAVPPGKYTYRVLVEDMSVGRQGFVYQMQKQKLQGEVNGRIDLGEWLFHDPALSGLEFAWEVGAGEEGSPFRKGPYDVKPQPSAYFGHFQDAVSVYYELYDAPPPAEGRAYTLAAGILNAAGDTVFTSVDSLRVTEGSAWPHAMGIDVSQFPAGHYTMGLSLQDGGGHELARSQGTFELLWSLDSWGADAADFYEVTAATLLPSDSSEVFRHLSMGEKERWIERIWRIADPTPDTGDNESREEFRRRVDYANAHYSIIERGMFSDRGRVYIRYGEPDDIKIERVPVAGKTLGYALGDQIPKSSKQEVTDTRSGVADSRAYEIWTYDMRGKELRPRFGMNEISGGIKFVFTDDQGYGEYTLKYSSTTGIH
ncbi:MAG: GWxTD domain-containing protein [Candidatus Eisenbacteria bacterium]|uniref:GWxTD domain-containing protein n=1 Tax=Eiseniibacteriota bacterium TaxID=2212470 RepID=A0A538TUH0_UNCEI|nr:MAG: GWxTD domain-containing protein [Candidatus Eisenbacteria bacterium]